MLITSLAPRHKMLLSLGPKKLLVWPQVELLHCRGLLGDDVDHKLASVKSPQLRIVLLATPVHGGPVHEGRELVELLPGVPLAHGGRADKVEAGHGFVYLDEKRVFGRNFYGQTFRIDLVLIFTAVE